MIRKYLDFINENAIELMLEANIHIEKELIDIFSDIESPLAKELIRLNGTDVDVNTNYITYDVNKDDKVLFKPDDKVEKNGLIFVSTPNGYESIIQAVARTVSDALISRFNIKAQFRIVEPGQKIEMLEIDQNDLLEIIRTSNSWQKTYVIDFINKKLEISIALWKEDNKNYFTLLQNSNFVKDSNSIKHSEIAVGRFVRALLKKADIKVVDKEVEAFVTQFKTHMRMKKDSFKNFEEVDGDDIKYWYLEDNYNSQGGSMGSSCMRYERCQDFLEIYTENPNQVKLIILKSDNPDKISGRALLWTDIKDRKFMDRIYTNDTSHEVLFIEYAISKGYHYKKNQNFYVGEPILYNRTILNKIDSIIKVQLESTSYNQYPYMDTLKFVHESDNILSSDEESEYNYKLEDTDGGNGSCDSCGGSGTRSCEDCDGEGRLSCWRCEGEGEQECTTCEGAGNSSCVRCDGDGHINDEDDNEIECPDCDGEGNIRCDDCDGSGSESCSTCDGDGKVDCEECNDGRVDCYDCN